MSDKLDLNNRYVLTRGRLETTRLNLQHNLVVKAQGWLLHPRLQEIVAAHESDSNFRVADMACGTGIAALDLSNTYPWLRLTALDISSKQFPPKWTVPESVTFGELDLLKEVPDEYVGAFDIIHLRFIFNILIASGKETMLANLRKMLKPGGWLQWRDICPPFMTEVDPATKKLSTQVLPWFATGPRMQGILKTEWIQTLDKTIEENGFVNAQKSMLPWKGWLAQDFTNQTLLVMAEVTLASKDFLPPYEAAELEKNYKDVEEKADQGTQYGWHNSVVIAQKPTT